MLLLSCPGEERRWGGIHFLLQQNKTENEQPVKCFILVFHAERENGMI